MQTNWKSLFMAGIVSMGLASIAGPSPARAQAVGGPPRAAYPGYYYSPGGYSGGTYFSPGYYPRYGTTTNPATAGTYYGYGSNSAVSRSPSRGTYYDPTTGRQNLNIPLSKPWLRPLR